MACGPPKVMKNGFCSAIFSTWKRPPSPLSSRPEHSVVEGSLCGCSFLEVFFDRAYPNSCYAAPDRSTCAAFLKESRMESANANNLDRNSGERSGGICCAPSPQTKALRVSSQILPQPFCSSRSRGTCSAPFSLTTLHPAQVHKFQPQDLLP